jgi:hypothetical protein
MDRSGKYYITGELSTATGSVPVIATRWTNRDLFQTIRVRWSVGRMNYRVKPGLYAVGSPSEISPVLVTGNFKLTFDLVRRELDFMNVWLLVLDTRGINVWCAAGKGTFSTKELVRKIEETGLSRIVNHRKVIVPQLGAVGIAAHEVREQSGFSVIYGPVRINDLPAFVAAGMKATPEMRLVTFNTRDRLKLIPVELMYGKYYLLLVPAVFFLVSGLSPSGYSAGLAIHKGIQAVILLLLAYLSGIVITPLLLPWIPFRRFSLKGLLVGWLVTTPVIMIFFHDYTVLEKVSWHLMIGAISSFTAMNFTGTSTFTSLSGVQKEMKIALPLQIGMASLGLLGWIISKFIG